MTTVYAVTVCNRGDDLYLFARQTDAEAFAEAVKDTGGEYSITREPVSDSAAELIAAEKEGNR
jgi:hypothetical protein